MVRARGSVPEVTDAHITHGLRAEYRTNALGIGTATPRLSWINDTGQAGWHQTAYELARCQPDGSMVETATVHSDESAYVAWPFAPLTSRQRLTVRVRTAGPDGAVGSWSDPLAVEAGLLQVDDWIAVPITVRLAGEVPERPVQFRRAFTVRPGLVSARLYVSAFGIYVAECNGSRVGDELLAPGWTSYSHRQRYATHDVARLIHADENVLAFTVAEGWYLGRVGFEGGKREIYGSDIGPIAQLELTYDDGTIAVVATDSSWRAGTGPHLYASLYDGERFDARLADAGWSSRGYDDSAWQPVSTLPSVATSLEAPVGPPVRGIETLSPVSITTSPTGKTLVDFGQNISGWLRIRVSGTTGDTITLRHAEVLEHGELGTRPLRQAAATDIYTLAGTGEETFEPSFTIHGFRYAEVTGWPGELTADALEAIVVHSDMTPTGTSRSSHDQLNQLHENVRCLLPPTNRRTPGPTASWWRRRITYCRLASSPARRRCWAKSTARPKPKPLPIGHPPRSHGSSSRRRADCAAMRRLPTPWPCSSTYCPMIRSVGTQHVGWWNWSGATAITSALPMLAPLVCGFQTGAATMFQVLAPQLGNTVVVFGAGGVGLSAVMAARLTPATRIIVVDVVPERLALATELGATHTVNAATDNSVEAIMEITGGRGADRILEATGHTAVLKQALTVTAMDAVVAIVGAPPFGSEVGVDVLDAIVKGPRIIGVNQGRSVPRVVIPALIDHFLAGRMPFDKLIKTYPLADINDAIHDMHSGATIKPVLLMPEAS